MPMQLELHRSEIGIPSASISNSIGMQFGRIGIDL